MRAIQRWGDLLPLREWRKQQFPLHPVYGTLRDIPLLITKVMPRITLLQYRQEDEPAATVEGNFTVTLQDVYEDTDEMDFGIPWSVSRTI